MHTEYDCPVVHCPVSMVVDTKGIVNFNEESIDDDEVKKYPPTVRKDYRVILLNSMTMRVIFQRKMLINLVSRNNGINTAQTGKSK